MRLGDVGRRGLGGRDLDEGVAEKFIARGGG